MEYSIGEVSAMLNMSRDMIRYYEKQGAIKASRKAENNYRSYNEMDVFWLLEAQQHKSWGIPINEISSIRENDYSAATDSFLENEIIKIRDDSSYKALLASRLEELRSYMQLGIRNIGNFWVRSMPDIYSCHLVTSTGDEYDRINLSAAASSFIFSERFLPFFDSGFTVRGGRTEWQMSIKKEYAGVLSADIPSDFELSSPSLCLCTHVDIGEVGEFDQSIFSGIFEYASSRGFRVRAGCELSGLLAGRGYEGGRFHRIVRLYLPIE